MVDILARESHFLVSFGGILVRLPKFLVQELIGQTEKFVLFWPCQIPFTVLEPLP